MANNTMNSKYQTIWNEIWGEDYLNSELSFTPTPTFLNAKSTLEPVSFYCSGCSLKYTDRLYVKFEDQSVDLDNWNAKTRYDDGQAALLLCLDCYTKRTKHHQCTKIHCKNRAISNSKFCKKCNYCFFKGKYADISGIIRTNLKQDISLSCQNW